MTDSFPRFMTVEEAAQLLGVSDARISLWIGECKLPVAARSVLAKRSPTGQNPVLMAGRPRSILCHNSSQSQMPESYSTTSSGHDLNLIDARSHVRSYAGFSDAGSDEVIATCSGGRRRRSA